MKFESEVERMQHAEARLIPPLIWGDFFNGELLEHQQTVMQQSLDGFDAYLTQVKPQLMSHQAKHAFWFALTCSHQDLTPELCVRYFQQLDIPVYDAFYLSIAKGRFDLFRYIFDYVFQWHRNAVFEGYPAYLRLVAKHGHVDILECLIGALPLDERQAMLAVGDLVFPSHAPFCLAAEQGHLDMMHAIIRLYSNRTSSPMNYVMRLFSCPVNNMIDVCGARAFHVADKNNHMDVMNFLQGYPSVLAYAKADAISDGEPRGKASLV